MPRLATAELDALRRQIAALERRPALAEGAALAADRLARGAAEPDPVDLFAAPPGLLHEIFADEQRSAGAALGFALGLARGLITAHRSAVLYLQLAAQVQELGMPYGLGFANFGFDPEALVLGRVETPTELLWAVEEAIACRAVAAVIADIAGAPKALDFSASRRLSLRAAGTGVSALLVRYGTAREASAAKLRWRLQPSLSGALAFDPQAPGPPRFRVTLEKGRLGAAVQKLEGTEYVVDWVENGFIRVERAADRGTLLPRRPPLAGAEPAALGDRLSQAG